MARSWAVEQRKVIDFEALLKSESVSAWYYALAEGDSRRNSLYRFNAFLKWCGAKGYSTDPDTWVQECMQGNTMTLIQHAKILKHWVDGEEFSTTKEETRRK